MKVIELRPRRIAPLSQQIRFLMVLAMFFVPNVVSAQAGPLAYVTNQNSDSVTVIDTSTNTTVGTAITLPTGSRPAGLAVTPDGKFVYVANQGSPTLKGSVSVIATSTNTVATTISLCDCSTGPSAIGVAITPDGLHAYVTDKGLQAVHVIDTSTNTRTKSITATTIVSPFSIAITPDGANVYATEFSFSTATTNVNMISTATNTVVATISVGNNPAGVAVSPDGSSVYVTNNASDTVSVFAAGSLTPTVTTILLPSSGPYSVAFTPDGAFAYVVHRSADEVSVINTATHVVTSTSGIVTCAFNNQIAITPNGAEAYVADDECSRVDVISTASNTRTTTVSVGSGPFGVAIAPSGTQPPQSAALSSAGGSFNLGWPVGCVQSNGSTANCDYTFGVTYPAGMFLDGSTATVTPKETTQAEWALRTPPENPYFGTDIALVKGKGGKGVIFSADCSGPCAAPNSSTESYNIATTWKSPQANYCNLGPGLLKADPNGSNFWVNTLINCTQIGSGDPTYGTGGTTKCKIGTKCLSDWANVFNIGGPIASASPFRVDFGNVELWHFALRAITLTNIGSSPLSVSSVKVASASGGDSDDFFALSLCFRPLGVGKSCVIFVAFFADPDQSSPQSATLTITDSANGSPHLIPLAATVVKED
jgi:YVTN family beta-propeller protein